MVRKWRVFGDFLRRVFLASRVQHISDVHSKFALRPHPVWKYGTPANCNLRPLRIGEAFSPLLQHVNTVRHSMRFNFGHCDNLFVSAANDAKITGRIFMVALLLSFFFFFLA